MVAKGGEKVVVMGEDIVVVGGGIEKVLEREKIWSLDLV